MAAIARAALLVVSLSLYAGAQNRSLALYAGEAHGLDATAVASAQHELQRLLNPAGFDILWKDLQTRKSGEQFDQVVVVSFDGSCSDASSSAPLKTSQEITVSLADSSVSEGRILPFVRVDCGYLAQMLSPALRAMGDKERYAAFGRALGRVMAHEIYHIVGETTEHQVRGVAKASFSVRDLMANEFSFDNSSLAQMRPAPSIFSSRSDSEELLER
jgi:hypothetical protein